MDLSQKGGQSMLLPLTLGTTNKVTAMLYMIHNNTRLTALCPGLPRWAGTRKVKPIWILLKQETVGGSGISWVICKSAPRPRQIPTPAPHHSTFYRPDALPATQPTASKHWRIIVYNTQSVINMWTDYYACMSVHACFISICILNIEFELDLGEFDGITIKELH